MEEEIEFIRENGESIYDKEKKLMFFIPKNFWFDFVWPIGATRQILSYKYTILLFDVLYVGVLLYYSIRFYHLSQNSHAGGKWFLLYFILQTIVNSTLPPLSMRLLKDIFTNEAMPTLFTMACKYDKYYHLRVSWICYLNLFGCFVGIFCSALMQFSPFYSREVVPFVIMFIIPTGLALSILIALMESNRLLQNRFIDSLQTTDTIQTLLKHLPVERNTLYCCPNPTTSTPTTINQSKQFPTNFPCQSLLPPLLSPSPSPSSILLDSHSYEDIKLHFLKIRSEYIFIYHICQSVGKRYGFVILLYVISLVMYAIYLIWFLYLIDDMTMKDIMPYLAMCVVGLVELTFTLTLVNENGQNIRRQIAKYVLIYTNGMSITGIEDITLLLACSQSLIAEIPFRGGFSLKFRHTAVIIGPLIASIIPTIVKISSHAS